MNHTETLNENPLLTRDQVMELLQCNSSTLWRYTAKEKRFPYYRAGRKMFFKRDEVLQAIRVS
jgi:predicted DNA-binding transcriptional regulator AlpA